VKREGSIQSAVSAVERQLRRFPRLYQWASRTLYRVDRSFYTLSPGLPAALQAAMTELKARNLLDARDYYEFGVFRGYALHSAEQSARKLGADNVRFYGFDSFQGLPSLDKADQEGSMFFEGQFACSRSFVESALRKNGADLSKITLVEGYFDASLTPELKSRLPLRPVGIAVIDCDLYSSTVPVLRWLDELMRPGSIVMMDDWRSYGDDPLKGQQLAFGEWLSARKDLVAEPMFDFEVHGRAFRLNAASR
jgi:O-methyltransferase